MRHLIWPVTSTLLGIALEIGNYSNRPLANVIWFVCGVLWLGWIVATIADHRTPGLSPEERKAQHQISVYERLGGYILTGETLLLRMSRSGRWANDFRWEIQAWANQTKKYLMTQHSQEAAYRFYGFYLAEANTNDMILLTKQMNARMDYLRQLRDDAYVATKGSGHIQST
jgi:hypothetical protein